MKTLETLIHHILFWQRNWVVVKSKNIKWVNHVYNNKYDRLLILEMCSITGFERAYYHDHNGIATVPVNVAKLKLEMITDV